MRDEHGRPRQRTVTTLGRLDQLDTGLECVIAGLMRVTGKTAPEAATTTSIAFELARDFADVWALSQLWNDLGFDRLRKVFGHTRYGIDVEALLRVMVFNRLCDPDSKLGVLRWLQTVSMPGPMPDAIEHQHLLRAMDALVSHQEEVESVLFGSLLLVESKGAHCLDDFNHQAGLDFEFFCIRQAQIRKGITRTRFTFDTINHVLNHDPTPLHTPRQPLT